MESSASHSRELSGLILSTDVTVSYPALLVDSRSGNVLLLAIENCPWMPVLSRLEGDGLIYIVK